MGWQIGYHNGRDIGYGVPAECDHPGCQVQIDRGLGYVCGSKPYGGEHGCGLFFCELHLQFGSWHSITGEPVDWDDEDTYTLDDNNDMVYAEVCERCAKGEAPLPGKPDIQEWIDWKLTDDSWAQWRAEHPALVRVYKETSHG